MCVREKIVRLWVRVHSKWAHATFFSLQALQNRLETRYHHEHTLPLSVCLSAVHAGTFKNAAPSTAQRRKKKKVWGLQGASTECPAHFYKNRQLRALQSKTFDIMQKCLRGVHKWGAETSDWNILRRECFTCWNYSSAVLSAAGSCICNLNLKNSMWLEAPPPQGCHKRRRGGILWRCDVGLSSSTWCVSSQVCVLMNWAQSMDSFWTSCFKKSGVPSCTYSFPLLFLYSRPLLHKGINSPSTQAEGAEGQQGTHHPWGGKPGWEQTSRNFKKDGPP